MRRYRNAGYAPESREHKLNPSTSESGPFLWKPTSPHHHQEWTCLPKSSRPSLRCQHHLTPIPHVAVELSGGPYDGARFNVPADTLIIDVPVTAYDSFNPSPPEETAGGRAKHLSYKDGGRLTLDGATVFTFAG